MATWGEFESGAPELAAFARRLLALPPAYLATVRADGRPRVHPVTPIVAPDALYVFMEPSSPKGRDVRERGWFALHNGVPDDAGTGGELFLTGAGRLVEDRAVRDAAVAAAPYEPADRYVLFELAVEEVRANAYGDVVLPEPSRWSA